MISCSSELAHIAPIFASEVAGEATALLLRVVDIGRPTRRFAISVEVDVERALRVFTE
jgi:hypothetical protein